MRSKPEGWNPAGPGSRTTYVLMLSRLVLLRVVRCREIPGQTADDAVLTLLFLNLQTGAAFPKVKPNARDWRIAQLTKRRSRTFITRPIARKTNSVAEPP
jgi:hypothetical protein